MEALTRMMAHGRRENLGGSPVLFGSEEALDLYLQSVLRECDDAHARNEIDILDVYSGIRPEKYIFADNPESTRDSPPCDYEIVYVYTPRSNPARQSVYERCQRGVPELSSLWTQMKYKDLFREDALRRGDFRAPDKYTCDVSPAESSFASTTPSLTSSPRELIPTLSLDPPTYTAPSKSCVECGNSFLTTEAFLSPPGYCEYSGRLICGGCFDPRPQLVPWRLLAGSDTIRGRVSRQSAELIRDQLYVTRIHYSDLSARQDNASVSEVHAYRIRLLTLRPVIGFCRTVYTSVAPLLASLPVHIREEETPEQALEYSLADAWDIVSPMGVSSVILRTLRAIVHVVETHADCAACSSRFERPCGICDHPVRTTSTEWTVCACTCSFHRKCLRFSTDGCPICAGLRGWKNSLDL